MKLYHKISSIIFREQKTVNFQESHVFRLDIPLVLMDLESFYFQKLEISGIQV